MWILKGLLLGLGIFFAGSIAYVVYKLRPIEADKISSFHLLLSLTIWNVWYWAAFVGALALGCWLVGRKGR